jgi:hypothetical protein
MNTHSTQRICVCPTSLLLMLLLSAVFTGCQSPDVSQGFNKGNVRTVMVDSVAPSQGMRLGLRQYGSTALSYAIVNKIYEGRMSAIQQSMDAAGINVAEMVHAEFKRQLEARGLVNIVTNNADAVFLLSIPQFGFVEYPPLTGNDLPFLEVQCRLLDRQESTLWKSSALQAKRGYPGMGGSLADYTDAAKLRADWETQIRAAVSRLLEAR